MARASVPRPLLPSVSAHAIAVPTAGWLKPGHLYKGARVSSVPVVCVVAGPVRADKSQALQWFNWHRTAREHVARVCTGVLGANGSVSLSNGAVSPSLPALADSGIATQCDDCGTIQCPYCVIGSHRFCPGSSTGTP